MKIIFIRFKFYVIQFIRLQYTAASSLLPELCSSKHLIWDNDQSEPYSHVDTYLAPIPFLRDYLSSLTKHRQQMPNFLFLLSLSLFNSHSHSLFLHPTLLRPPPCPSNNFFCLVDRMGLPNLLNCLAFTQPTRSVCIQPVGTISYIIPPCTRFLSAYSQSFHSS